MNVTFDDKFDAVLDALDEAAQRAANDTAEAIAAEAAVNAPVQSGALKAGIYAAPAGDKAAYEAAASAVHGANSKVQVMPGAGVEDFSRSGVHAAVAESIVDYSAAIHNGYSGHSGRPFLENAFNANEGTFQRNLDAIADDLKGF